MFPTRLWKFLRQLPVASAALMLVAAAAAPALAIEVQCEVFGDADAFGWSVATGGDYDGDGVGDIAVGAPCAWVGSSEKAGRVRIFSGATGALIASLSGTTKRERYGAALEFIPDLNNDGKAELAIGASTFDAPKDGGGTLAGAGRVEIHTAKPGSGIVWQAQGPNSFANLGEAIALLPDYNSDGRRELAVGASEGIGDSGKRTGVGYVLSGANGAVLGQNDGDIEAEHWASVVGSAGDADGDGVGDWFASANLAAEQPPDALLGVDPTTTSSTTTTTTTTSTTLPRQIGHLAVISGKPPFERITEFFGEDPLQRLGRAAAAVDAGNGTSNLWIGSSGDKAGNQSEAGAIELYSGSGSFIRRITEPTPQTFAGFGTAIVVPGSLDGGAGSDVVASAPTARTPSPGLAEAGRVHAFNGSAAGPPIWTRNGTQPGGRLGWSLDTGIDFNGDGVPDVVAGSPGATPVGKRGAGAAFVLSGTTGAPLATFAGRRGRETRFFIGGPGLDRRVVIRNFDPFGHRREAEIRAFRGQPTSALSMAMLDQAPRLNSARMLVAVGAGKGGGTSNVAVYRAIRRRTSVSLFPAALTGYTGSVNVAGGNLLLNTTGDEIAVAPADDVTGTVDIAVHRKQFTDPDGHVTWIKNNEFAAFRPDDKFENTLISAVGVNLAAGNVFTLGETDETKHDEIIAAPAAGLPVVRVFNPITGAQVSQWQAFSNEGKNSGVALTVANLKGGTDRQIVTVLARGRPSVKAWKFNGELFNPTGEQGDEVNFFVNQYGPVFDGGLTVTAADIDFDGADEIIVAPGPGIPARVLAFEMDGSLVAGWPDTAASQQAGFEPFGPLATGGLTLVGTNDFWRP